MVSSTIIITIPLTVLALFMANVVVSHGQRKMEEKVEIAILWDNAKMYFQFPSVNLNDYRGQILVSMDHYFDLDLPKVRVAIIDFDTVHSHVRRNFTTVLWPLRLAWYDDQKRYDIQSIALNKALQNAKDQFTQSRRNALKVVFVILASKNGLNEAADVEARKLRNQSVLICVVVFCTKDEKISRLLDIADETDVYKHYREDTLSNETAFIFADKAVSWLKERIRAKMTTTTRRHDPTSGQPPGPKPEPGPPPPAGMNAAPNLTGLYVVIGIVGTLIVIGIGTCIWCGKRQRIPGKAIVFRKGDKMLRGEIIVEPEEKLAAEHLLQQAEPNRCPE